MAIPQPAAPAAIPNHAPAVMTATDPPARDDRELVAAAQRGRREAVAEIYRRYWRPVRAAILARVPVQDAEDLVQDVFAAAVRRLSDLRSGDSLGAWLLSIARNRSADYWRRTRETEPLPDDLPSEAPPVAEAKQVLAHIRALPETYRELLVMRFVEGLSGPEIAELTGMTHGSVRVTLHRGMALLRSALAPEDEA